MSAPVLNKKQQRKSLSGLKKRKKVQKNLLALPENAKISKPIIDEQAILEISQMLESLLPQAQLPKSASKFKMQHNTGPGKSNEAEVKEKRSQLLLGVNSVGRGVTSESVVAVLFADDITPKLLINHLIILCTLKNIPFIFMPRFRKLTKDTLGFPCIVLGFKKGLTHFAQVVELIKSASEKSATQYKPAEESESEPDCNEVVKTGQDISSHQMENKKEFAYLYRTSFKKRVFIPEGTVETSFGKVDEFISVETVTKEDVNDEVNIVAKGNNNKQCVKEKSNMRKKVIETSKNCTKHKNKEFAYSVSNIMKLESNPEREKKKFKKLKKKGR